MSVPSKQLERLFVDESYSFYPFDVILPCTSDGVPLHDDFTDVGRTRDRSELAVFQDSANHGTNVTGDRPCGRISRAFLFHPRTVGERARCPNHEDRDGEGRPNQGADSLPRRG